MYYEIDSEVSSIYDFQQFKAAGSPTGKYEANLGALRKKLEKHQEAPSGRCGCCRLHSDGYLVANFTGLVLGCIEAKFCK